MSCPRACFAYLLILIDVEYPGRTYAPYDGVYIIAALLWAAEALIRDRWDEAGAGMALLVPPCCGSRTCTLERRRSQGINP